MINSLVTGGAGFIGSNIVRSLIARGDRVRVFDNFSTGFKENLTGLNRNLEVIEGDLRDPEKVKEAVSGMDVIFHLAAMVSVPQSMVEINNCIATNEQGTINLFEAARQNKVQRVILSSTCAIYGDSQDLPLKETTEPHPLSPYAATKLQNELYARLYTRTFGLPVVALRYFNIYGPRQRPDSDYAAVIPIFANRMIKGKAPIIYGDGGQKRDFVYVGDVVKANLLASESSSAPGNIYNICTGQKTSILQLAKILATFISNAPEPQFASPRAGDIYLSLGDPAKAERDLGFRAITSLDEGLGKTVQWMKTK